MGELIVTEPPGPAAAEDRCRLRPDEVAFEIDPASLELKTTADVEPLDRLIGQDRALRSLELGLALRHRSYNVYLSGMSGARREEMIARLIGERARHEPAPPDWVYVHNFDEPDRPQALRLPAGQGTQLRDEVEQVIERLRVDLPAALKAKDFDAERERLRTTYGEKLEALFKDLAEHATRLNLAIHRLPTGMLVFVPLRDNEPLTPEQMSSLSDEERADLERKQQELGQHAEETFTRRQELTRQMNEEVEAIVREFARRILDPLIEQVKQKHPDEHLVAWLERVHKDLLDNLERLRDEPSTEDGNEVPPLLRAATRPADRFLPYRVNVVADNSKTTGAPVVLEISPSYRNLFGTIEHDVNLFGRVTTDFTHIRPGSVLRASGGYLIFDLADALTEPLAWKQLKRTLKSCQLSTDVYEPFGLLTASALKPEPIPVDVKVIVLGSAELYYLIQRYDDDFDELFRTRADFGPETPRDRESQRDYARFIARVVGEEKLPPFDAAAIAEIIRHGVRLAGHRNKLTVELAKISDLVREAGHWARLAGMQQVGAAQVQQALHERCYRKDRIADYIRELIQEGTLRITLEGRRIGQVNGLSVLELGDHRFGRPCRVTAAVGIGQAGIINIERESELSGSTHNKGVFILEGYLRNRYAGEHPLALSASLAFEQSYGWIEGDSASSAELYCLLSALAAVPLRQDIAVTGSVNQHGEIQAVGGINEKIEGFFDVCRLRGLTGTQGVCIPWANVNHLILRPDVAEAVRQGQFHLWAIDHIDEGIELLTGMVAGDLDRECSFHHRLDQRLRGILKVLHEEHAVNGTARSSIPAAVGSRQPIPPMPGESD